MFFCPTFCTVTMAACAQENTLLDGQGMSISCSPGCHCFGIRKGHVTNMDRHRLLFIILCEKKTSFQQRENRMRVNVN